MHNIRVGVARREICEQMMPVVISNADALAQDASTLATAARMIAGIEESTV